MVFTLPQQVAAVAYQNKAVVYGLLFEAAAETLKTIAGDPKHLGAEIGFTAVLHTWGQTLTYHPHVHCIVPGGGLAPDGTSWVACRPGYFVPERILSSLFRGVFLGKLAAAHKDGRLQFFSDLVHLAEPRAFSAYLAPIWQIDWVVDCKQPFAGPEQVLRYLSRYTHRVAISDHRLVEVTDDHVSFSWKDYSDGSLIKLMTLAPAEFIRRFLLHVLPDGFQRIRHYGFLANANRAAKLTRIRELLPPPPQQQGEPTPQDAPEVAAQPECAETPTTDDECQPTCPECGGEMEIVETLAKAPRRGRYIMSRKSNAARAITHRLLRCVDASLTQRPSSMRAGPSAGPSHGSAPTADTLNDTGEEGAQLIGARFREDLVLDAAQAIEDQAPTLMVKATSNKP